MEKVIKATNVECTLFICAHYAQKKIDTKNVDWVVLKKYKDLEGNTCRDYYHEELGLEAIVVSKPNEYYDEKIDGSKPYKLHVLENASYMIFVREKLNKPTYYFAPFVNNNGFMLYIEDARRYDQNRKFETKPQNQKPYVLEALRGIFKNKEVVSLREDNMFVSFPTLNIDEVCKVLMKRYWKFTPEFFNQIETAGYLPYHPEVEYLPYKFPEYKKLDKKGLFDTLLDILTDKEDIDLKRKDFARIKSLIEKLTMDELLKVKKIIVETDMDEDEKISAMINTEINKKRSFQIFNRIANGAIAQKD